jgi:hypothetical protein
VSSKQSLLDPSLYLSYVKESGTNAVIDLRDKWYPFVLPGLGTGGEHCMCKVLHGIGVDGRKIGYINYKCKRLECPNCYVGLLNQSVFERSVKLEAYARYTKERPAHVTSEVIGASHVSKTWNLPEYDNFHRRSYRHISSMGGSAGLRNFHPYKIHKHIKDRLKLSGYGVSGNGYWKGVRENVLKLSRSEDYFYLSPHDHNIVFPSFLTEHSDNHFFVKKIDTLEGVIDVVKLLYYISSHCGVLKDTEDKDNHPSVFFGKLKNFKPLDHFTEYELLKIKKEVAAAMNMRYFDGDLKPEKEDDLEDNTEDFYPISLFRKGNKYDETWIDSTIGQFPIEYQDFWRGVVEKYNNDVIQNSQKVVLISALHIPLGIDVIEVIRRNSEKYNEVIS